VENMRKNGEIFQKKLKEWFFREWYINTYDYYIFNFQNIITA